MDFDDLLRGLDADQRVAVTCPPSATIVQAGAGSGKTRVLTQRIAYRVATGSAQLERVLAITFTREAASEMKRRLNLAGVTQDRQSATVGTFHAVALALLRQRLSDIGKPIPTIIQNRDQLVLQAAAFHSITSRATDLLNEIDWAHARLIPPANYAAMAKKQARITTLSGTEIAAVYKKYEQLKLQQNIVDLDDLISKVVEVMRADTTYAQAVRWRFRHIFVDEAQDMNPLQFELFESIRGQRADVFVVGDPMQAIYGWNGSDKKLFDNLGEQIRGVTILHLPNNYRCSPQILAAAKTVAKKVQPDIDIKAIRIDSDPVVLRVFEDQDAEASGIAKIVNSLVSPTGGDPLSSTAILVRTNAQVALIVDALVRSGIAIQPTRPAREISSAIAEVSQCTNRQELTTWSKDILTESDSPTQRDIAQQVQAFLQLDQPRMVDGKSFAAWTHMNTADQRNPKGVEVLTFHSAKGREWNFVIVAGAEIGLMPHGSATTKDQQDEEVRLAYVALTRGAQRLFITWCLKRKGRTTGKSPLLDGIESTPDTPLIEPVVTMKRQPRLPIDSLINDLKKWRRKVARETLQDDEVICSDAELRLVERVRPNTVDQLAEIFGAQTAKRIAPSILPIIESAIARESATSDQKLRDASKQINH